MYAGSPGGSYMRHRASF